MRIRVLLNSLLFKNLPGYVFFRDVNLVSQHCNKAYADYLGLQQSEDFQGISYEQVPNKYVVKNATLFQSHDKKILSSKKEISILSIDVISQANPIVMYGSKTPILNEQGEIQGILGQALLLDFAYFSQLHKLVQIKDESLTRSTYEIHDYRSYGFTSRESACYFYLLRGYTSKGIAKKLAISPKTVEFYLANIKKKLNCYTKTQLIEKAFDLGLIYIIPPHLIALP